MTIDSRGIEYDSFFASVQTTDGAVYQVLVTNEDGEIVCDMEQSAALANGCVDGQ